MGAAVRGVYDEVVDEPMVPHDWAIVHQQTNTQTNYRDCDDNHRALTYNLIIIVIPEDLEAITSSIHAMMEEDQSIVTALGLALATSYASIAGFAGLTIK